MALIPRIIRPLITAAAFGGLVAATAAFTIAPGLPGSPARPAPAGAGAAAATAAALAGQELLHIDAASAGNVWADGYTLTTPSRSVILHWNGSTWSPTAFPGSSANSVGGVSAVSADDAWLVGSHCTSGCKAETTMIMHWDGHAWSLVAGPPPYGSIDFLSAINASSASNAWAVGSSCNKYYGTCVPLMLHWNGTAWSRVASPAVGLSDSLASVITISAGDAWAVGRACIGTGCSVPLVMHWNGTKWSNVTVPSIGGGGLDEVAASSASDVWAVGNTIGNPDHSVIFHWNGATWSRLASIGSALFGVTATSASDAWAVGYTCGPKGCVSSHTLIVHWNGKAWSRVASPSLGQQPILNDVSAASAGDAWAVGADCNVRETHCTRIILHWNGKIWT